MKKRVMIGSIAILIFAIFDYIIINNLILSSNTSPLAAMISTCLFITGLDLAPTFAGFGLYQLIEIRKLQTTSGKARAMIFLLIGSSLSIAAFAILFIIRLDLIQSRGGFDSRYTGLYGDLLLTLAPYTSSGFAFAIGIWAAPSAVEKQTQIVEELTKEEKAANGEMKDALNRFETGLADNWYNHFSYIEKPKKLEDALDLMRCETTSQLSDRLQVLLPQLLNIDNLVIDFTNSFKEIFITEEVVLDPQYVSAAEISHFADDSEIGIARDALKCKLNIVIDQILQVVNNRKAGIDYVKSYR